MTLEEHDRNRWQAHQALLDSNKPRPNGIDCPKCGGPLWDSCPGIVLMSYPPQKNVHCPSCGHQGYALL